MLEWIWMFSAFVVGVSAGSYEYCTEPLQEFLIISSILALLIQIVSFILMEWSRYLASANFTLCNFDFSIGLIVRTARLAMIVGLIALLGTGAVWAFRAECCTVCPGLLVHFTQTFVIYHFALVAFLVVYAVLNRFGIV
jgi:hypothetical protein